MSMKRTGALSGVAVIALTAAAFAQDVSGEIKVLNWFGGAEADNFAALQDAFVAQNPDVSFSDVPVSFSGDPRGGIRTALMGGEQVDLIPNTWPAFRAELAAAGAIAPLDDLWDGPLGENVSSDWKEIASVGGTPYAVPYSFGNRSGMWHRIDTLADNGIDPPRTYDDLMASFDTLNAVGITPYANPAKFWAHGELFETLFIRMNGIEAAQQLVAHEIAWTDDRVKAALAKYGEMLEAGCCGDPAMQLGADWNDAARMILNDGEAGFFIMGMWVNSFAMADYGVAPGEDYTLTQFPAMGLGHDDTSIVDNREWSIAAGAPNPEATQAFIEFVSGPEGSAILAGNGWVPTAKEVDASLLDPVMAASLEALDGAKVIGGLGDQLPGDVVDEFRVQLQLFIQDPSAETIDAVTQAIEAKAQSVY